MKNHDETINATNNTAQEQEQRESATQQSAQEMTSALKICQDQVQEWKDKFLRLSADFDNFKRRLEKDQASWQRMIQTGIFLDILGIVDDFDRAFAGQQDHTGALAGFALIRKNLQKLLEKNGITEIKEVGEFNPQLHEAVMSVPADEQHKPGSVVQILQRGYRFKDQVLRPAKVSIAQ